ncbi:MAG: transcription antitermination factor NusB [Williamsia sp.]|nr:transcription antitermination factor NusB [Williamsia sp.]
MISRRNIRVKVMQTLYSIETGELDTKTEQGVKMLQRHFDQSRQLFVYLLYFLSEVARYAEKMAVLRASKHLPTEEDLHVNIKLAGNEVIWKLMEDPSYQKALKDDKPHLQTDKELIKKMYLQLVATPEYTAYIGEQSRGKKEEKDILVFIFQHILLPDEAFTYHIEELFTNWDDDCEMIDTLVTGYLQKPNGFNFQEMLGKEKWEYGRKLLETVLDKKDITMGLIQPKLTNWDAERIATLDMILMQMGVCEFLYFETIPPKVTINEYIDLAKEYSTPQSGQFVNGILDSIHKDMLKNGTLNKVSFRKP